MNFYFCIALLLFTSSASANPLRESGYLGYDVDGAMNNQTVNTEYQDNGYMVLLDYSQDLLIIKNTTTQKCFFSPLERYDFLKNDSELSWGKGALQTDFAVTVPEEVAKMVLLSWGNASIRLEKLSGNVKVAQQCIGRPSFQMIQHGGDKERRGAPGAPGAPGSDGGCCSCGCCCGR